jgi:hypothetical protein
MGGPSSPAQRQAGSTDQLSASGDARKLLQQQTPLATAAKPELAH